MRRAVLLAAGALLAASFIVAPARAYDGLFATTSYRNAPLAPDAPVSPLSKVYVSDLARKAQRLGVWVNTTAFSTPVYTVGPDQPTTTVTVYNPSDPSASTNASLQQQWTDVPLPPGAQPAAGTDGCLVIYQPNVFGGRIWEFWRFSPNNGHPFAVFGGRLDDVVDNPGYFADGHGASASGIPLLVGLQRIAELRSGAIDHAVNVAISNPGDVHRWPAQRDDGTNPLPTAVKEGMRFRLPASLDIDALHMPPYATMVAKAIQRYGLVVTDGTGSEVGVVFYAEDPTPTGTNPYVGPTGIFDGIPPSETGQFLNFPWDKLQLLK